MKQFVKLHLPSSKFYTIIHYCSYNLFILFMPIYFFLFRVLSTLTVACISSLIWAEPNSCFNVAFVEAYSIFCLTGALSGDQLNSNHSWPREFFESNLKKMNNFFLMRYVLLRFLRLTFEWCPVSESFGQQNQVSIRNAVTPQMDLWRDFDSLCTLYRVLHRKRILIISSLPWHCLPPEQSSFLLSKQKYSNHCVHRECISRDIFYHVPPGLGINSPTKCFLSAITCLSSNKICGE